MHYKSLNTKSSQSTFTSLYLVTALHNGYSSTIFSLYVSWYRIFSFRCPLVNTPQLNSRLSTPPLNGLNCTTLTCWTEIGRSNHIASERTHREHRLQHLFHCCVTSPRTCSPSRPIATAVRVAYRNTSSIVSCGHYLATAAVSESPFSNESIRHNIVQPNLT
jgi:hypothetical protein